MWHHLSLMDSVYETEYNIFNSEKGLSKCRAWHSPQQHRLSLVCYEKIQPT